MRRSGLLALAPVAASLWLGTEAAPAQIVGRFAPIHRPSMQSPSILLDRLGGRYTRHGVLAAPWAGSPTREAPPGIAIPRRRQPASIYAGGAARIGQVSAYRHRGLGREGLAGQSDLYRYSGFASTTSVNAPVYGRDLIFMTPVPQAPLYQLQPQGSPFQQYFGLTEAPTKPDEGQGKTFEDYLESLGAQTQANLHRWEEEALVLFAQATGGRDLRGQALSDADRTAHLHRVVYLLSNVRRLDENAVMPSLLICHAHLEQRIGASAPLIRAAIHSLVDAAIRRPAAFAERPNVASFFGDADAQTGRSARLERQMRHYVRLAIEAENVDGLVLQAYCAWTLGDARRAAEALGKAEALLAAGEPAAPRINRLIAALRYAL